jgi:hypothetical protein
LSLKIAASKKFIKFHLKISIYQIPWVYYSGKIRNHPNKNHFSSYREFAMIFFVNSNAQKIATRNFFPSFVSKSEKLGTLLSNQTKAKKQTKSHSKPKTKNKTTRVPPVKRFLHSYITRLSTLSFQELHMLRGKFFGISLFLVKIFMHFLCGN